MELSILLARSVEGKMQLYPMAENIHRKNIFHATRAPAQVNHSVQARAQELPASLAEDLNYCEVMALHAGIICWQIPRLHLYGKDHPQAVRKMGHFLLFERNGHGGLSQAEALL